MTERLTVILTVFALAVLAQTAQGQSTCRISLVGSGTAPSGTTVAASAIRSASVVCEGEDLTVTGPAVLRIFAADWTGVTFTASARASALLTISGSQVVIQQSTFRDLNLAAGSVLSVVEGTLNLTGSTFSGNTVRGTGSVLNLNQTDASIQATTFQENSAEGFGGAVSGAQGTLSVTNSRFIENQSGVAGGGISYVGPQASQALFRNVTFSGNLAVCRGGAAYLSFVDELTFTDSIVTNNSVTEFVGSPAAGGLCISQYRFSATAGNGLFAERYSSLVVNNTLVDGNSGNGDGCAMFLLTGLTTRILSSNVTNNQQGNGAVAGVLAATHTTIIIEDSFFVNNTGPSTGAFLCQGCAGVNVTRTGFDQNEALETERDRGSGGAMCLVASCARLCYVSNNQFTRNKALTGDGGAMFGLAPVNLTVVNNLFDGNVAANAGGMVVTGSGEMLRNNEFIVRSNVFRNNRGSGASGIGGGMGFAELRSLEISDCTFDGNSATTYGGGLYVTGLANTIGTVSNCTFTNNRVPEGGGGGAYMYSTSRFTIEDISFRNNSALSGGGSFTSRTGRMTVRNVTYLANSARDDSGAHRSENTELTELLQSTFTENSVSDGFGGASLLSGFDNVLVSGCQFDGNTVKSDGSGSNGGAIHAPIGRNITLQDSSFDNNSADANGGGFSAIGLAYVRISGTNFTNCSAGLSGGGVYMAGTAVHLINSSLFRNNQAPVGGGIAIRNVTEQLFISDGTLDANTASTTGGGLLLADTPASSTLNITDSTITDNEAGQQGGGITFVSSPGATLTITDTVISNNKADAGGGLYGDDGVLFATLGLQQSGNSASRAGTADLGCGNCRSQTGSGSVSNVSNAPASVDDQVPGSDVAASGGGSNSLSGGAIAGIVLGVLAAVALLAVGAFFLLRRRRQSRQKDVEVGKTSAVNRRPPVKSAFSEEGTGSFWSQNRSTPNGSVNERSGGALDGFSSHEFDTDKTAKTAPSYTSSAPLITLHSDLSNGSNATQATDMTIPGVPWSDWQIDAKDIQVARRDDGREWKLGGGAFGEVYKALLKGVNPVAVKVLRDQSYTSRDEFSKEVALLKALHNSHIVQFQGACVEEDKMLLITEFMDGGDLFKAIARKQVTWQLRGKSIVMDVLRGLHFLHSKRIVHMDLKSPNILLTRHGVAKLADVGLAKVIRDRNYITQVSVIGTFAWAAPEVLTNERCTEKADIFSFGIVLWEIVTGEKPVRGGRRNVSVPEECSQEVADIIAACLQTDPDKRPTASEVLQQLNELDSEQEPDVLSL